MLTRVICCASARFDFVPFSEGLTRLTRLTQLAWPSENAEKHFGSQADLVNLIFKLFEFESCLYLIRIKRQAFHEVLSGLLLFLKKKHAIA